jgi:hypothetical protein
MPATDITAEDIALFRRTFWFRYTSGKKPESAQLHLEGEDGPLESFTGPDATRIWQCLEWWRGQPRGNGTVAPASLIDRRIL